MRRLVHLDHAAHQHSTVVGLVRFVYGVAEIVECTQIARLWLCQHEGGH